MNPFCYHLVPLAVESKAAPCMVERGDEYTHPPGGRLLDSLVRTSMEERQTSRDGPPSKDESLPAIASPPRPHFLLDDDDADAYTISTQRYARTRSIFRARGDNETLNSTRSLYDSDVVYYDIHGRRYCKQYGMPNDEDEQLRMHLLNDIYYVLLGQRLTTVPLVNPRKILDIGTGIGEWAMAMGDHFPNAEVIGTDIAKIQPTSEPVNVFFELEDAEQEGGWTWADNEFDFIHFRYLCGAFTSWTSIYKEAYRHLKPGGWIEVLDFDDRAAPAHDIFENTEIIAWVTDLMESSRRSGRPRSVTHMESSCLEELGFVDVQSTVIDIPVGVWHEDEQVQKNGKHFLVMVLLGLEAVCLRPLTEQMGWTPDRVRETCEFVARELWKIASDPDVSQGFGFKLKILVGRKPGGPEAEASQDPNSSRPVTADESAAGESSLSGEETPEESASGA